LSRCAQCHGVDARATGPLALKSTPPTPDLTTLAFRQRLARYPGVIVSSIVLRPNGNLIPATLARNGVKLPDHIWTDQELRLIDQYLRSLIDHSRQIN
jgi:mono/diheme cytochrome c family protein